MPVNKEAKKEITGLVVMIDFFFNHVDNLVFFYTIMRRWNMRMSITHKQIKGPFVLFLVVVVVVGSWHIFCFTRNYKR